jgi:hypothetical protein
MRYPAQSDLWRLDLATKPRAKTNGKTITEMGKSRILATARQIMPLTLFPDTIRVEELRIVWIRQLGFWMNEVVSTMATDIGSVNCKTGMFFGNIHVQSLTGGREIFVENLLKKDVLKLRSLVEGIALSAREGLFINSENLEAEKQSLMKAGAIN